MSRVHALPAAVLSVALLVSACSSGGSEPVATPSSSATPTTIQPSTSESSTPTADPTPTAPAVPAAATKNTDAGAEAFARYWVKVLNYAQRTGDVGALDAISDSRCTGCTGAIKTISNAYQSGGGISGGDWSLRRVRALPADFGGDWGGYAQIKASKQVITTGSDEQAFAGGEFDAYFYPAFTQGGWTMRWLRTPS